MSLDEHPVDLHSSSTKLRTIPRKTTVIHSNCLDLSFPCARPKIVLTSSAMTAELSLMLLSRESIEVWCSCLMVIATIPTPVNFKLEEHHDWAWCRTCAAFCRSNRETASIQAAKNASFVNPREHCTWPTKLPESAIPNLQSMLDSIAPRVTAEIRLQVPISSVFLEIMLSSAGSLKPKDLRLHVVITSSSFTVKHYFPFDPHEWRWYDLRHHVLRHAWSVPSTFDDRLTVWTIVHIDDR